jgi:co-chaperonin GroES (HSP10)
MAVTLLNTYIAVRSPEMFSGNEGVMRATVALVGAGVTGIVANDFIFYPKSAGKEIRHNGNEYIIVRLADVIGKVN